MDHFSFEPENPTHLPKPSPKCERAWVLTRVQILMASYRKADYHNPEGFIATLGTILEQYPPEIVEYVTDPTTGIQRRLKFPPSPAEVVEACTAEVNYREKVAKYSSIPTTAHRLPKPKYSSENSYDAMVAKHGRPFGVFEQGRQLPYGE